MGEVNGPRRDRRPPGASNAVWPITLCLFRVSDHLFVVGVIKRTFEALYLPNNTSFYNIIMSSSTPRSAAPLRRSARGGARGFKASSGKQARIQSSGLRARGATADGDGAATLSDDEQSDDGVPSLMAYEGVY